MPNWCTTDMIVNSDEQKIHKLYNLISDWVNTSNSLLLNIVIKSGIDECDQNGNFKNGTECRGTLCDFYEFDDGFLHLQFENAWEPMFGMWFKIFDKYLGEYNIEYRSEEPGSSFFATNIDTLVDKYSINVFEKFEDDEGKTIISYNDEGDYYSSDLEDYLRRILNSKSKKIETLLEEVNDRYSDYIYIFKWEYIDPIEFY